MLRDKLRKDWDELTSAYKTGGLKAVQQSPGQDLATQHPKAAGAILAAVSLYFIYVSLISPLIDSSNGVEEIRISVTVAVLSITFFVMGIGICLFGPSKLKVDKNNLSKGWVIFMVVLLIVAFGAYIGLELVLDSRGYIKQ